MSAIDEFCRFVAKFGADIAVTQYGDKNLTGSMPVILWGLELIAAEALTPSRIIYHSVIRYLCEEGYIYTREQFLEPKEFDPKQWYSGKPGFDEWLQNMIEVLFLDLNRSIYLILYYSYSMLTRM